MTSATDLLAIKKTNSHQINIYTAILPYAYIYYNFQCGKDIAKRKRHHPVFHKKHTRSPDEKRSFFHQSIENKNK
jgi:hypothetical protein